MRFEVDQIIDPEASIGIDPITLLRSRIESGRDWPSALLESMSVWALPEEVCGDRTFSYFIGGEAFDWVLLAERLTGAVADLIPTDEREQLVFFSRLPDYFDASQFRDLLGVDKYRGYLNYFYGVTVEEALQLAVEREVHKRAISNSNQYQVDFSDDAFQRIYRESKTDLLVKFIIDTGCDWNDTLSLTQAKEFTYWLFKFRVHISDKAKTASDTRKGLRQLQEMMTITGTTIGQYLGD